MLIDLFPDGLPTEHDKRWLRVVHMLLDADDHQRHRVVIRLRSRAPLQERFEREYGENGKELLARRGGEDAAIRNGLIARFPRHLRVVAASGETSTNGGAFVVHWTQLEDASRCQGSSLVGEGGDDIDFFTRLAKDTLRSHREREGSPPGLSSLHVQFSGFRSGGGDQLGESLKRWVLQDGPILAIVDSDRRRPGGGLGDTATKAQKAVEAVKGEAIALSLFIPEGWRNVENCVPEAVVERIGKKKSPDSKPLSPDSKPRIERLKVLGALGLGESPFLKLRAPGTTRKVLISPEEAEEAKWLRGLLGLSDDLTCLNPSVAGSPLCAPLKEEGRKKEDCRCPALVEGIRNLMTHALRVLSEDPEFKPGAYNIYDAHPDGPARKEFQRLGVELMSFGLAAERRRA